MSDALDPLLTASVAPIDTADLGRGARLLVPNGAAFGTPQIWRGNLPWDWVRQQPDAYWVPGDRGSSHAGVDLGFFVRRGSVFHLPVGLPVRAPLAGVVESAGRDADPERGPAGKPRLYTHLTDFAVSVRRGATVKAGDVLGTTVAYSRRWPIVVLHFGIGVLMRGAPPNMLDPTPLLRRWRVRHPVEPGSTCDAAVLNRSRPGTWRAPGVIDALTPVATVDRRWLDVWA